MRADGAGRLIVEDRLPGPADIVRLPNAAVVSGDVEHIGLGSDARGGDGAPAAKRPDHPPTEPRKIGRDGLRNQPENTQ